MVLFCSAGKHDGSVGGRQYFRCNSGFGVLVRPDRVSRREGGGRRHTENRASGEFARHAVLARPKIAPEAAAQRQQNRKSWSS